MLRVGTILHGTYRIERYLSSGGFGNTYVAVHTEFNERYAVKEFFMKGITQRDGDSITVSVSNAANQSQFAEQKEKFKKEARRLRGLEQSACSESLRPV
jgi:serine/threonine protein kinase